MKRLLLLGFAFTAGLLHAAPRATPLATPADPVGAELQASFISASPEATATRGSYVAYRKSFTLASNPRAATLRLFADARYLLWLNGKLVTRGPNRFEVRGPEYDVIDLTGALRSGENTVAILVMSHEGSGGFNARMMKNQSGLTLRLDVDGRTTLRSDESWRWSDRIRYRPAKIDWAKIVDVIDSTVETADWTQPEFDDSTWSPARKLDGSAWGPLIATRTPPLRDTPVRLKSISAPSFPVTLQAGQKLTLSTERLVLAYTTLDFNAAPDTRFRIDYAGIDCTVRAGRQNYVSSDTCATTGGTLTVLSGSLTVHDLRLVERLYPFDRVGSFRSSDPALDRLWAMCARSLEIMSEDSYTDCADRERAEWMDNDPPAFDITRTAFSASGPDGKPIYSDARLLGAMLRRTALTVQKDGWVKAHTCSDRFDVHAHMEDRSCDWIQGARRHYESTGNAALIREIWPVIVRQLDFLLQRRTERGLVRSREWVVWGNPLGYVTCEGTGLNAFVYKALIDASLLGRAIGEAKDADRFAAEAAALSKAINTVLWNEAAGTYYSGYITPADLDSSKKDSRAAKMPLAVENNLIAASPFAALWALDQELVPKDRRARVTDYLIHRRHEDQHDHVMVYYYLFKQLYAADTDAFDREILNNLRTNWKTMADSPWQTSWEAVTMSPQFRGSKAHIYGMFPGYFLSAYVLGVRPQMPASQKRLLIEPRLGDLTFAEGTVATEGGPVAVSWKRDGANLHFRLDIPSGMTTTLRVPTPTEGASWIIGGKPVPPRKSGRYLETTLQGGIHEGVVGTR